MIRAVATPRTTVHALVDELDEDALDLALQALQEIRDGAFELTPEEARELAEREAECDAGDTVDARSFLAALREERPAPRG
jgi:hypothetical protein